jgi:hypothetical protein
MTLPNSATCQSSGVSRSARCAAASSLARVVFPAPGSPTIRQDDPAAQEYAVAAGGTLIRRYALALPRQGQAMRLRLRQPRYRR